MVSPPLRAAVIALRATQRTIRDVTTRADEGWRHRLITLRGELAGQVATIFALLDQGGEAVRTSTEGAAFRSALSSVRSALSRHQASWPAVAVDVNAYGYDVSVSEVRASYDRLEAALDAWDHAAQRADRNGDRP